MSLLMSKNVDLGDILSQVADLSENSSLDFDVVADHCDKMLSVVAPSFSGTGASAAGCSKGVMVKKAGKKQAKKRAWKKPKDKPNRPLSAYNFFFKHEREKIVMATAEAEGRDPEEALKEMRTIITKDGKRKRNRNRNRKSHGKIGFAALAKTIAEKWKVLDDASKSPFEARATKEKQRYQAELEKWSKEQKIKKENLKEATLKNLTSGEAAAHKSKSEGKAKLQRKNVSRKPSLQPPCLPASNSQVPLEHLFTPQKNYNAVGLNKDHERKKNQQDLSSRQLTDLLEQATAVLKSDHILSSQAAPQQQQQQQQQRQQQQQSSIDIPPMPDTCNSAMNKNMLPLSSWMMPIQQPSLDTSGKLHSPTLSSALTNNKSFKELFRENNSISSPSLFGLDIPEPSMIQPKTISSNGDVIQPSNFGDGLDEDYTELFNLLPA